jgi:NAD(P)-dependent dehydrogenase (short-subunit alcohol dehydrogenase family)
MGQVRALADRLGALERIDVLINNAGFMAGQRRVTADGFDEVFAVNHLAPFLLTNLLLGKLAAAGPAGVITEGTVALADRGTPETGPVTAPGAASVFAGLRFPPEVISVAVRWYLRYGLSHRDIEEPGGRRWLRTGADFARRDAVGVVMQACWVLAVR